MPAPTAPVERLDPNAPHDQRWTGNDESRFQHHGVVALSESPLTIQLRWRVSAGRQVKLVGYFRLHLRELLDADLIRTEERGTVRLRSFHAGDGGVYVQRNLSGPRLFVEKV
jgi:hypothetical protein